MKIVATRIRSLTRFELVLWIVSLFSVSVAFAMSANNDWLTLMTSCVGLTALIFVAKGDIAGQILTVLFSCLYAVISWRFNYYGEMITYMGMTTPIALMSVVSWARHPYAGQSTEVTVAKMTRKKTSIMWILTALTTLIFFFILRAFSTANLTMSTVSIATSFLASYLMLMRSKNYALAYAANDCVLITLWSLASMTDTTYTPMVVCFVMFLLNDLYGFASWHKMQQRQCVADA